MVLGMLVAGVLYTIPPGGCGKGSDISHVSVCNRVPTLCVKVKGQPRTYDCPSDWINSQDIAVESEIAQRKADLEFFH
eukprot:g43075.t1